MVKKILLSLLIFVFMTSIGEAANSSNPSEIQNLRYSYGSGTVRIVLDMTQKVEYEENSAENPSRSIIDIKNSLLNPNIQNEVELKSTAAKNLKIEQRNSSTVRLTVETMAGVKIFWLSNEGGGYRLVIDVGNAPFKINPDLNNDSQQKITDVENKNPPATKKDPSTEIPITIDPPSTSDPIENISIPKGNEIKISATPEIQNVRYSDTPNAFRIVLDVTEKVEIKTFTLKNPARTVFDIKDVRVAGEIDDKVKWSKKEKAEREIKPKSDAVKKIRLSPFDKSTTRLVVETSNSLKFAWLEGGPSGYRLVIDVDKPAKKEKSKDKKEQKTNEKEKDKDKNKNTSDDKKDKPAKDDSTPKDLREDLNKITALTNKTIVIDPGHGGGDSGAIGPTGVMEKNVTLRVSLKLEKLLQDEGAIVIMTRRVDKAVSPSGDKASAIEELQSRCTVANVNKADIFISVHADSFTRPDAKGTTGYYYSKTEGQASIKLADFIRKNICALPGRTSRGTKPCNFYVVRNTDMPATLIELAFISNPEEEQFMNSDEGVEQLALAIFDGIEDYFGWAENNK